MNVPENVMKIDGISLNEQDKAVENRFLLDVNLNDHKFWFDKNNQQDISWQVQKRLIATMILCFLLMLIEIVGGFISNSLALFTDAIHLFSDLMSFGVSLIALHLGKRKSSDTYSFGYARVEPLGALFSLMAVWVLTFWIFLEAYQKLKTESYSQVKPIEMLLTSVLGLIANIIMGFTLHSEEFGQGFFGHSHGDCKHGHAQQCANERVKDDITVENNPHNFLKHKNSHRDCTEEHHRHKDHPNHDPNQPSKDIDNQKQTDASIRAKQNPPKYHKDSIDNDSLVRIFVNKETGNEFNKNVNQNFEAEEDSKDSSLALEKFKSKTELKQIEIDRARFSEFSGQKKHSIPDQYFRNNTNMMENETKLEPLISKSKPDELGSNLSETNIKSNSNLRAAWTHILGGIVQSVGVVVCAVLIIVFPEWKILDPFLSVSFSILAILFTVPVIRDLWRFLMDTTPVEFDLEEFRREIRQIKFVCGVHDLHVWLLSHGKPVMTAQVTCSENSDYVLKKVTLVCRQKGIYHSTVQVELEPSKSKYPINRSHNAHD